MRKHYLAHMIVLASKRTQVGSSRELLLNLLFHIEYKSQNNYNEEVTTAGSRVSADAAWMKYASSS